MYCVMAFPGSRASAVFEASAIIAAIAAATRAAGLRRTWPELPLARQKTVTGMFRAGKLRRCRVGINSPISFRVLPNRLQLLRARRDV